MNSGDSRPATRSALGPALAALLFVLPAPHLWAAQAAAETDLVGKTLSQALQELAGRGLRVVFSDRLVRPQMTVSEEPRADDLREILDEILTPHGLAVRDGPAGTLVVVAAPTSAPESIAAVASPPQPYPATVIEEEIRVTPSRFSLLRERPAGPLDLGREEIVALPHLGDDIYRALTLLPGLAGNDVSARFHVRGSRRDETLVLLDGQELYDAFHLKDYDGALSLVPADTLASVELTSGAFPSPYGDRMSGVLDMTTVEPADANRFRIAVSFLTVGAGGSGTFHGDRGSWLLETRRGSADLVGRLIGDERPLFWDALGKAEYRPGTRSSVRLNLLASDDELEFDELSADGTKQYETKYANTYLWLTQQTLVNSDLLVETAASFARVDRNRRGREQEDDVRFTILDRRDSSVLDLRQRLDWSATAKHGLTAGAQYREFDTDYDYFGAPAFDNPLALIRHDRGEGETTLRRRFEEQHGTLYASDRWRLSDTVTAELGLRYDRHSRLDEHTVQSPLQPRLPRRRAHRRPPWLGSLPPKPAAVRTSGGRRRDTLSPDRAR